MYIKQRRQLCADLEFQFVRFQMPTRDFTLPNADSGFHAAAVLSSSCSGDLLSHSCVGTGAMADDGEDFLEEINTLDLIDSDFADADDPPAIDIQIFPKAGGSQHRPGSSSKQEATQCSCFCRGDLAFAAIWLLPLFVVS